MKQSSKLLLLVILMLVLFSSVASAEDNWWYLTKDGGVGGDAYGDTVGDGIARVFQIAINTLGKMASATVDLPFENGRSSALAMFLTFIIIFALIYPATSKLNVFSYENSSGPRKAFAVSFAILVVFFSPVAGYVYNFIAKWVSTLTNIALILIFILALWWIINMFRHGLSETGKIGAKATAQSAENAKSNSASAKVSREAKNERKILRKETDALQQLETLTHQEKHAVHSQVKRWENIRHKISKMGDISTSSGQTLRDQIIGEITSLMRSEHHQEEVNEMIYKLSIKGANNMNKVKKLIRAERTQLESIERGIASRDTGDDRTRAQRTKSMINSARNNAYLMYKLSKKLENFAWDEEKYASSVNAHTLAVIDALRNNKPETAGQLCHQLVKELHKEEKLLNELKYTEGRMHKIDHHLFHQILELADRYIR